ncbi:MAG: DUF4340 domain-containing protein [Deltaproteobacteria bacterium]|nr:DUF4340 domain-containing protein [Deltaproteobacteria bacterium]
MKKEYIILAAIIVGLSVYLTIHKSDKVHYTLPEMAEISQKDITKIEISKKNESITLTRQDDKWVIGPDAYPADSGKINKILDIIDDLSLTALVSESENYIRYDLGEDQRIHVRAFKGDALKREFDIGKAAPSFRHTFIRVEKDPKVYHARKNFRSQFEQTVDNLRDKTVLSFDGNEIQEIAISMGDRSLALSKKQIPVEVKPDKDSVKPDKDSVKPDKDSVKPDKDSKKEEKSRPPETKTIWQDGDGKTVEDTKINSLLSSLSGLKCKSYLPGNKEDLKEPVYTVHLRGIDEQSLSIFKKTTDESREYPAISSWNSYAFVLEDSRVENIISIFEKK